ncbi:MAG: hypothetical protein U9O98_00680, partial [Asgard group archaeon]|nr:hypothetical protein [Asgard group archaeon]
ARKPWNITLRTAEYLMDFSWGTYYSRKVDILFSAIVFNVTIEKNQRKDIYIDYQRNYSIVGVNKSITTGKFRYIVGSTESWGKALKFSHFEIWINEPIGKKMAEVRHYRNWMPQDFYEQFTFTLKK